MKYIRSLILTAALVAPPGAVAADGESNHPFCNTTPNVREVVEARGEAQMRRLARELRRIEGRSRSAILGGQRDPRG